MKPTPEQLWDRFQETYFEFPSCRLALDLSRLDFDDDFLPRMKKAMAQALQAMADLEGGKVANPDEGRRVGHFWLRDSARAPDSEVRGMIDSALKELRSFAAQVHSGELAGA